MATGHIDSLVEQRAAQDAGTERSAIRRTIAEQIAPIAALQAELAARWEIPLDLERARQRIRAGMVAYDPLEVIGSAGELVVPFMRATKALERAGVASNAEAAWVRERSYGVLSLITAWLAGEAMPRDSVKRAARRAAAVVGQSILRRASEMVRGSAPVAGWARATCPCCGGPPEFALREEHDRLLLCARCDTAWRTEQAGCVGCGASSAPALARVSTPSIGYRLTMCNACGRYLKERDFEADLDPLVERALTEELDRAAERRGLRL